MGEYILLDGRYYKLGTLESLYYVRFDDLRAWVMAGRAVQTAGNLAPAEYLGGTFRFRFPFPDEDADDDGVRTDHYAADYDRGVMVTAPAGVLGGVEHFPVSLRLPTHDGTQALTVRVPCPYHADFGQLFQAPAPDGYRVEVLHQRPVAGRLWVVLRCAWCSGLWRLDEDEASALAAHITATQPEYAELARRIVAGYLPGAGAV